MNWVDYIILGVFLFSILAGFGRGFVKEIVSLITLVLAFIIAIKFSQQLANYLTSTQAAQQVISQTTTAIGVSATQPASYLAVGISFTLLFVATVMVGSIVGYFLNMAFQFGILGFGNRLFGAAFGLLRGFLFILVIIFVIQLTPISQEPWWDASRLVNAYQPAVQWLARVVSPGLEKLRAKYS